MTTHVSPHDAASTKCACSARGRVSHSDLIRTSEQGQHMPVHASGGLEHATLLIPISAQGGESFTRRRIFFAGSIGHEAGGARLFRLGPHSGPYGLRAAARRVPPARQIEYNSGIGVCRASAGRQAPGSKVGIAPLVNEVSGDGGAGEPDTRGMIRRWPCRPTHRRINGYTPS